MNTYTIYAMFHIRNTWIHSIWMKGEHQLMNKKDVVHIYNGVSFHQQKEGFPIICNNRDRPREHYAKQDKSKTSTIWYHLYMESKKVKPVKNEIK